MRPEGLQVVLRPRSSWEAVELGTALVRRHAGAVWRPWLALSLPVFILINALFWWLDQLWLAGLALWWWLPVFDRIPLYVLSRAIFGQTPGVMQTLRALPDWRRGRLVAHLLWRRLNPWRALGLPVDLLEDGNPAAKRARRWQIIGGQRGHGLLLAWLCANFVLVLMLALVSGVLLFVPGEWLPESARVMWQTLTEHPPRWLQVALNAVLWIGLSVIEPFHIGAGFGLYLNRRAHLEGWDIELALRRLRARLGHRAGAVLLSACLLLPGWALPTPVSAQTGSDAPVIQSDDEDEQERPTLADVFGTEPMADARVFIAAVEEARQDPLFHQQRIQSMWIPRTWTSPAEEVASGRDQNWHQLAQRLARSGEIALWMLVAGLAALLILTVPHWWPWMRRRTKARPHEHTHVHSTALPSNVPLPPQLLVHVRRLWQTGERRQALALLYRSSLGTLAGHSGIPLSASATEADCLRLSRRLPEPEQHAAFAHMVQVWRRAAYAGRWPGDAEFEALCETLAQHLRWPA